MTHLKTSDDNTYGGEWSLQKLRSVEAYLEAYLQAMSNRNFELWYIDAFSGDGVQRFNHSVDVDDRIPIDMDSDIESFTAGSSLRALKVSENNRKKDKSGFDHFIFIEYDKNKLCNLKERIADIYPNQFQKCVFICGDVNEKLPELISSIPWMKDARGVCFIDPWATQLNWSVLEAISKSCCDVWLLFPIETINRLMPRESRPLPSLEQVLIRLYGDDGWKERYTYQGDQLSMFDEPEAIISREKGCEWLIEYTSKRLKSIFPGVSKPGILKRDDGVAKFVLYALVPNKSEKAIKLALKIANHIIQGVNKA